MADLKSDSHSRRKFISLGLLAGAGAIAGNSSAQSVLESGETVKMLTQDGKLVEVDKALMPPPFLQKQATKRDVLSWIHPEEGSDVSSTRSKVINHGKG